jgi:hypothetical protein
MNGFLVEEAHGWHSPAVLHSLDTFFGCTIGTAVEDAAMTNDLAPAMMTSRSQGRNGTFEAVEDMCLPTHEDLKGLIIVINHIVHTVPSSFLLCLKHALTTVPTFHAGHLSTNHPMTLFALPDSAGRMTLLPIL